MSSTHHPSRCGDLLAQICDYIDGELEPTLCAKIEQHLAGCEDCRVLVDTTRKTVILYRHHSQVELPSGVKERLWQALEEQGCLTTTKS